MRQNGAIMNNNAMQIQYKAKYLLWELKNEAKIL